MKETIEFRLNNELKRMTVEGSRTLLWVLRDDLGLTGTKFGCGEGICGACTVVIDKEPVRSCQATMSEINGSEVVTIEGLSKNGGLHKVQKAFIEHDALQCGFCTPGMIMSAYSLLLKNSNPSREDIIDGMEDNLCRCGAHNRIVKAVETASR